MTKAEELTTQIAKLDDLAEDYSLSKLALVAGEFERGMRVSQGIKKLKKALAPAMPHFMDLAGSPLGFRTDKDYSRSQEVVLHAMVEATMKGVSITGNEFNIIAGRCYITREGFTKILADYPGLSELKLELDPPIYPKERAGTALVQCKATWKLDGKADSLERLIPIIAKGGSDDTVLGKANRKLRAAVYEQLTGSAALDGDVSDGGAVPVQVEDEGPVEGEGEQQDLRSALKAGTEALGE